MNTTSDKRAAVEAIRRELDQSKDTRIWRDFVNALRLVSQVVFTRSSGFILEFIQNAEDAGKELTGKGEVSIAVNQTRLKFIHNGKPFEPSNLEAICGIRSSKKPERGTLGYLGIGFKSVFKVADRVEIYSNGYAFKFDRNHHEWSCHAAETPWHVIPIWIEQPSEPVEADKTTFIIQLRNEEARNHLMDGLKAIRAELYLFLIWIKSITVADEVSGESWSVEDLGSTPDGITTLKQNSQEHRFKFFRREVTVPEHVKSDRLTLEYRANVTKREIAVAFAIDATGKLNPSPATAMYGGVYSFLPLGESKSGAKFPIQADFLVQPGRDSINAEALWNHWLLEEVASLCQEAIQHFQQHQTWKYQYLAAFDFKSSPGYEAYDRLFGPRLITPIEKLLAESPSVPTADDQWAKPSDSVLIDESPDAVKALTDLGILAANEVAPAFGGAQGLVPVHAKAVEALPNKFKKVNRLTFFANKDFLESKAKAPGAPSWFRALYTWLQKYPLQEMCQQKIGRKWTSVHRPRRYHSDEIVLRADNTLSTGGPVCVLDLGEPDAFLAKLAHELQTTKPTLHPNILAGMATDQERETLKGFLIGFAGVQKVDAKAVCLEAILPKITIPAQAPLVDELLTLTKYCRKHLESASLQGKELWVINKRKQIRKASEVLFPVEFKPNTDWETLQQYVLGSDFLTAEYLSGPSEPQVLAAWREFLHAGRVKYDPDNGVEIFGMKYAEDKLAAKFTKIVPIEKLNHGYDMEAEDAEASKVYIEVKGQSVDADVELTENETTAAQAHNKNYYLCVVSGIPETPTIHLVRDPHEVGTAHKLTIRAADWKRERLDTDIQPVP